MKKFIQTILIIAALVTIALCTGCKEANTSVVQVKAPVGESVMVNDVAYYSTTYGTIYLDEVEDYSGLYILLNEGKIDDIRVQNYHVFGVVDGGVWLTYADVVYMLEVE